MKKSMKAILSASVAALCVFGVGLSASAYELNAEVKDVTQRSFHHRCMAPFKPGSPESEKQGCHSCYDIWYYFC